MTGKTSVAIVFSLLLAGIAHAQVVPKTLAADAAKQRAAKLRIEPTAACTPIQITIPTTRTAALTTASCYDSLLNSVEDIYTFTGTAGQTITVDYSSTQYELFLWFEGLVSHTDGTIPPAITRSPSRRAAALAPPPARRIRRRFA